MNRRRLDFEATRDALLAVAGRLDSDAGRTAGRRTSPSRPRTRRTLYGFIDRLNLPGLFRTFDFPNPDATSPERVPTTVPQQALFLMNNPLVHRVGQARAGPRRTWPALAGSDGKKISRLYRAGVRARAGGGRDCTGRKSFVSDRGNAHRRAGTNSRRDCCLANEFVFVD